MEASRLALSNIIQWIIRGLQASREELSTLLSAADPVAVCLQETLIKASRTINFSNYLYLDIPAEEVNGTVHGGVALLVKSAIPHSRISLNTGLQQ